MKFEISRREVLNNLIRFKDSLLEKGPGKEKKGGRIYRALLNRKTGDLRFAQKILDLEHHITGKVGRKEHPEDWKEIQIIVEHPSIGGAIVFEMLDARKNPLKPSEFEPLAWKVASETLDILNLKARESVGLHPEMLPEEAVLQDLSSIQISSMKEDIEDLPGWMGAMSRIEAEHILTGNHVGTYLLREGDELTISISFHFAEENMLQIHPFLVTVVEDEDKISDILLLRTNRGWTLYHDDPNLNDTDLYQYDPSPRSLLYKLPLSTPVHSSGQ